MFTINELSVGYGPNKVLRDISLNMDSGAVTGIVGYNGAGKTTLLNAVYGLVDAPRDTFTLNGEVLKRTRVAYLTSRNFFYSNITGRDYLELFRQKNGSFDIALWQEVLRLPLDDLIESYSAGMQKKLALLGILALDRQIVILDEPFNGLDIESVAILQMILRKLADLGHTVIVTSHIIESLTSVCDVIARLRDGRIEKVYARSEFELLTHSVYNEVHAKYSTLIESALGSVSVVELSLAGRHL